MDSQQQSKQFMLSSIKKVKRTNKSRPESHPISKVFTYFIVDRSGSMSRFGSSTMDATEKFLKEQKELEKKFSVPHYISVRSFDDKAEEYIKNNAGNVKTITKNEIYDICYPRGTTRLYDTILETLIDINKTSKEWFETQSRETKKLIPIEKVPRTLIIFTDGEDNQSKIDPDGIKMKKELIKFRKNGGTAIFMGTDQDAILRGQQYGFHKNQCLTIDSNEDSINNAFDGIFTMVRGISSGKSNIIPELVRQTSSSIQYNQPSYSSQLKGFSLDQDSQPPPF